MITEGAKQVGRFSVQVEVANRRDIVDEDRGLLEPDKVRRLTISGVVDSGATRLVLPRKIAEELGLPFTRRVRVRYANNRTAIRDAVEDVHVQLLGRHGVFTAVVEPKRTSALIGAIVLEDLDLLVDCTHQRLVPRDPRFVISELE